MNKRILLLWVMNFWFFGFLLAAGECRETISYDAFASASPPPLADTTIIDTISLASGTIITRCFDTSNLTAPFDTIFNICFDPAASIISFAITPGTHCIKYRGLSCGTDTACIVICDELGFCDTTTLIVTAIDPDCFPRKSIFYDTLFVNMSRDHCVDLSELSGNATYIENYCPDASGESIVFTLDPQRYCVNYAAVDIGTDTACILVRDDRGFTDTLCYIITGKVPTSTLICDTILLNTDKNYCIVNDELEGNIDRIENICPSASGTYVNFNVNPATFCVQAFGIDLGTDSACVIICDEFDICDTTYFKITVVESPDTMDLEPPIAVNDTTTTKKNTPIVIHVLGNDTVPGGPTYVDIVTQPLNGTAFISQDIMVIYVPNTNFCGLDSLQYRVCNAVGCDTAWVFIDVPCVTDTFFIYTGMSPDGNGQNETFTIKGIENFPNNIVRVYNRWGNLVFEAEGYRNTWTGQWQNKDLPDGTYFYLIDLRNGSKFSGFLQINR